MEENNKTKKETFLPHLVSNDIFLLMFTDCVQLKQENHPKVTIVSGLEFEEFQTRIIYSSKLNSNQGLFFSRMALILGLKEVQTTIICCCKHKDFSFSLHELSFAIRSTIMLGWKVLGVGADLISSGRAPTPHHQ
jgi:hypothetical protein